jgi:enoyl-CoA hydratase/carnithine racemase
VVPPAELDATVADLAAAATAPPYGAVSATKAVLQAAASSTPDGQLRAERRAQAARIRDLAGDAAGNNRTAHGVSASNE